MKRVLLSAIAIAVLIAGCGSGGSTTKAASQPKTTTTKPHKRKHKPHKKKVVHHKKKVVKKTTHTGGATTTAVTTTTSATTTYVPPPTTTQAPPPPTTTQAPPPPTTTQQAPPPKKKKGGGSPHGHYCLSVADRIDTPSGSVLVAQVRPGMRVWSTDLNGRRIAEKVLAVHQQAVPASHQMVRLRLANGHTVLASLGHPLPSGQPVSSLAAGQRFEGTRVVSATRVRYGKPYTYDLLPAGPTHTYYADGVLLGSTLAPTSTLLSHPF